MVEARNSAPSSAVQENCRRMWLSLFEDWFGGLLKVIHACLSLEGYQQLQNKGEAVHQLAQFRADGWGGCNGLGRRWQSLSSLWGQCQGEGEYLCECRNSLNVSSITPGRWNIFSSCLQDAEVPLEQNHPGAESNRRGNTSTVDLTCYRLVPLASSASPREFGKCAVSCTFLSPAALAGEGRALLEPRLCQAGAETGWCWEEKHRERYFLVQSSQSTAPLSPMGRDRTNPGRCCSLWGWEVQLSQGAQNEGVWAGPLVPDSFPEPSALMRAEE